MRQKVPVRGRGGAGQSSNTSFTSNKQAKSRPTTLEKKSEPTSSSDTDIDEENSGFGGWLKSEDGVGYMKMFVITNSVIMLTTVGWPHITKTFEIVKELIFGEEE